MSYDPYKHHRRSTRLRGYDYSSAGAYFVTILTYERQQLFGTVIDGAVQLSEGGRISQKCWQEIPAHYPNVILDKYIVMPDHIHGIIVLQQDDAIGGQRTEPLHDKKNLFQKIIPRSLGAIIRGFKIGVTKWFRENTCVHIVWHRNYHDRIIRDEPELDRIRKYIVNNPLNWDNDRT